MLVGKVTALAMLAASEACIAQPYPPAHKEMARQIDQATAVKDRHMDSLYALPAVQGAGVGVSKRDSKRVVIQVFVSRQITRTERRKFPKALEGVPVEILETGGIHTLPAAKPRP